MFHFFILLAELDHLTAGFRRMTDNSQASFVRRESGEIEVIDGKLNDAQHTLSS